MINISVQSWKSCVLNKSMFTFTGVGNKDLHFSGKESQVFLYDSVNTMAGGYGNQLLVISFVLLVLFVIYLYRGYWIDKFKDKKEKIEKYYEIFLTAFSMFIVLIIGSLSKIGQYIMINIGGAVNFSLKNWKLCNMNDSLTAVIGTSLGGEYGVGQSRGVIFYRGINIIAEGYNNKMFVFALCLSILFLLYIFKNKLIDEYSEKTQDRIKFYYEAILTGLCFTLFGIVLALSKFGSYIVFKIFG